MSNFIDEKLNSKSNKQDSSAIGLDRYQFFSQPRCHVRKIVSEHKFKFGYICTANTITQEGKQTMKT